MNCFQNAYGITRTPCECLQADLPEGYQISDSGIYLDEYPEFPVNLQAVKSIADCGKEFPLVLKMAIAGAERVFKTELYKALQTMYRTRVQQFEGIVGSLTSTGPLNYPGGQLAGLKLTAQDFRGASVRVDKINVAFQLSGSITVSVYKRYQGDLTLTPIRTIALTTSANVLRENVLDEELELPLSDDTGKYISYYFLYQTGENQPMNNAVNCNCGQKEQDLRKYVVPNGVTTDMSLINEQLNGFVNGILPHIVAQCDTEETICAAYNSNPNIRLVIQDTLAKKAVELLLTNILTSNLVNRYTMSQRETMKFAGYGLSKKFSNNVQWLAENMDVTNNDCFMCNPKSQGMMKAGILS